MITNLITKYFDGDISLEDALLKMEEIRKTYERELKFLQDFKHENSEIIEGLVKEYPDGYNGFMFEVRNGRTTYSFKNIEEWNTYYKALKECEDRYKQAFISVQKGLLAISSDGEELQLPEVSYGKPSVIIKELKTV